MYVATVQNWPVSSVIIPSLELAIRFSKHLTGAGYGVTIRRA
jgi:hypothetical protein